MQRDLHANDNDFVVVWDGTQTREKSGTKGELLGPYESLSTLNPSLPVWNLRESLPHKTGGDKKKREDGE